MMKVERWIWALVVTALSASYLGAQSVRNYGTQSEFALTAYPLYGVAVAESDTTQWDPPIMVRADTAGAVTARCVGGGAAATAIVLNLAAGEFIPCQVVMVLDTGTDAIAFHGFN
jgi:hypothetical protein